MNPITTTKREHSRILTELAWTKSAALGPQASRLDQAHEGMPTKLVCRWIISPGSTPVRHQRDRSSGTNGPKKERKPPSWKTVVRRKFNGIKFVCREVELLFKQLSSTTKAMTVTVMVILAAILIIKSMANPASHDLGVARAINFIFARAGFK